jgi:hypothetical protein
MTRHRTSGILSFLLAATLALTSVTTAFAATPVPTDDESITLLQSYGIVKGDQFGNLNLEKPITRAEAATIFVRVLGQESTAALLADLVPFTDSKGHWAAGYITVAYRLGVMKGRSDTQFDPEAMITNQEVYTVLLRLIQRDPGLPWNPPQIMQISKDLGLTPSNVDLSLLGPAQALRGTIFRSLGKATTSIPLADGRTVLGTYVDTDPPHLTLDTLPTAIGTGTVHLTGSASGAAFLLVNNQKFKLTGDRFAIDVQLTNGSNELSISAFDWAGNATTQTVSVTRAGNAATILVAGEVSVKAGQTVPFQAIAYDANGIALPASTVSATVSGNLGSYNAAAGTFTAGANAGTGTITFKAGTVTKDVALNVLGLSPLAKSLRIKDAAQVVTTVGKIGTVTVEILDKDGIPVPSDDGRTVSLSATGLDGLSVLNTTAVTQKGVATFSVSGTKQGTAALTASSTGLGSVTGSLSVATSTRILLSTVATNPVADGNTPIIVRAQLVNEKGEAVANTTSNDIRIQIETNSVTTNAFSNLLIIPRGKVSSEGSDAALTPGQITELVGISGRIISTGHNYTVVGTSVQLTELKIGTPVKLDLITTGSVRSPGLPANFTVRVLDSAGNLVPTGSYGFQISATTTNGETVLPDSADLTVGTYDVEKGKTGAMVARTKAGTASVVLTYPKSGKVTLKVVPVQATAQAVDSNGEFDATINATGLTAGETFVLYSTTPDHAVLKWDVGTLKDQDEAVLLGNGSSVAKLKVYVYDDNGGLIPNISGTATIKDNFGTPDLNGEVSRAASGSAIIKDGVGEFSITSKSVVADGTDTWEVKVTPSNSNPLTPVQKIVRIVKEKLGKPSIDTMQGSSGVPNRVLAGDDFLDITFLPYAGSYGSVKLYRSNGSLVWTSPIINLGAGSVQVPRNVLDSSTRYAIKVDNGAGESLMSDYWPSNSTDRVVKEEAVPIDITGARYNAGADGGTLTVTTNTSLSGGILDPIYLSVYNAATNATAFLSDATSCVISGSSIICKGLSLPTDDFYGNVVIVTENGWWTNDSTGKAAVVDVTPENNKVAPMATLTGATISYTFGTNPAVPTGGTITLTGVNLSNRLDLRKLTIGTVALGTTTITNASSTTATFSISGTIANSLYTTVNGSDKLSAATGWLTNSNDQNAAVSNVGLYADIELKTLTYDKAGNKLTITLAKDVVDDSPVDISKIVYRRTSSSTFTSLSATGTTVDVTGDTVTITWASDPAFESAGTDFVFTTRAGWLTTGGWDVKGSSRNFRVQL